MKSRSVLRIVRLAVLLGAVVAVALYVRGHAVYRIPENDQSLAPRYPGGSRVLVAVLDDGDPVARGDDVLYEMESEGTRYARYGRIAAVPGDRVEVRGGLLVVNGEELPLAGPAPAEIAPGSYFILARNPLEATYPDSRRLGCVPRGRILAKLLVRIALGE